MRAVVVGFVGLRVLGPLHPLNAAGSPGCSGVLVLLRFI
jgi:hypothetical protein